MANRKILIFALLIFLLMTGLTSHSLPADGSSVKTGISSRTSRTVSVGTVMASTLNVRETATAASKIIGTLPQGANAYIICSFQGWYKVTFNAGTGWVSMAYVENIRPLYGSASSVPGSSLPASSSSSLGNSVASSGGTASCGSSSPACSVTSAANSSACSSIADSSSAVSGKTASSLVSTSRSRSPVPAPSKLVSALPSKVMAGYYTNWSAYSGFSPDKINASLLNVVHYAFAGVGTDLKIALGDPAIDFTNFSKLAALKKSYPNLKTLISIGGWDGSARFSDMALTHASRRAFAQSCVDFIRQYGFDGVDIDWEYPVSGGAAGRPEDKTNFTLLMQTLRSTLSKQAAADGRYYYLTFAGGASNGYISNVQLPLLAGCVDYAVDMTYDLHGPWDAYSDLNAPLYTPTDPSPQYKVSVDSSLRAWQRAGFPPNKLVMGVPFYGYRYSGVSSANNGLYSRFTSAKSIGYDSVVSNYLSKGLLAGSFQTTAQVPALFGGTTFISYENASSAALKARYSKSHGLRGVSVWELSYDRSSALLSSVYRNLS